jgi:hypothetical protein
VLGCDVAEGIEVGDYVRDDTAVVIRRADDGFVSAIWVGKIQVDELADLITCLGLAWNTAYVCVENNSFGAGVNQRLWKQYPKYALYRSKLKFDPDSPEVKKVGFTTSGTSKNPAIYDLAIAVSQEDSFWTYAEDLLQEMRECCQEPNGKINTNGKDVLMAAVMSEVARTDNPNYCREIPVRELTPAQEWKKRKREQAEMSTAYKSLTIMNIGHCADTSGYYRE